MKYYCELVKKLKVVEHLMISKIEIGENGENW